MKNEFDSDSGRLDAPRPATFNESHEASPTGVSGINAPRSVFSSQPLFPVSFADGRNNRRKWSAGLVVGALALSAVGMSFAQKNQSPLPAPPAMTAPPAPPAAGAPRPDGARPDAPPAPSCLTNRNDPVAPGAPPQPGQGPKPGQGPIGGPLGGPREGGLRDEGGPRPGGPGPDGPRPEDANTQVGASHALERAYRSAGEVGTPDGEARDLSTAARTFYAKAMQAFEAKQYAQATAFALSSDRLSHAACAISGVKPAALANVPGLTPPPSMAAPASDDKSAARELSRNYDEWNRAPRKDNALSTRLRTLSEANYRAALQAYNAKQYENATTRARQGAEQAKAARDYAEALAL